MRAVKHSDGPMLVLAGPGSGKTMVITHRVKHLLDNHIVHPENVLVITFTKASAKEMKDRFVHLMHDQPQSKGVVFGTFHSIYFRIIRRHYGYDIQNILKEEAKIEVFRKIIRSLMIEVGDEYEFIKEIISELSQMKGDLIDVKYYHPYSCSRDQYVDILQAYENYKRLKHLIDFDDMLTICWHLLEHNQEVLSHWQNKFKYILIDEFQDINRVQYEIIKKIAEPSNHLFIVGDDDQSIYQFRGAKPEFLLKFTDDYSNADTTILNYNYRSTSEIVYHSNQLIRNNTNRKNKEMKTINHKGVPPVIIELVDSEEEALRIGQELLKLSQTKQVDFSDMAVIYRTNLQARALMDVLSDMNIPFTVRDKMGTIYDHWITKDILAYLRLARNCNERLSLSRIINKPNRYISKSKLELCLRSSHIWHALHQQYEEQKWMVQRLDELKGHFQVLRKIPPSAWIPYIRTKIGYDEHVKSYADFKKMSHKGLMEILDELHDSTSGLSSIETWFDHIEKVQEHIHSNTGNKHHQSCVTLSTMHSAKGLEFTLVWIIGANEGIIPHQKSNREKEIEEERRLFYVAMTRAKELLYISHLKNRHDETVVPSRFIQEIKIKA